MQKKMCDIRFFLNIEHQTSPFMVGGKASLAGAANTAPIPPMPAPPPARAAAAFWAAGLGAAAALVASSMENMVAVFGIDSETRLFYS